MDVQNSLPVSYGQHFRQVTPAAVSTQVRGRPLQPQIIDSPDQRETIDIVYFGEDLEANPAVYHSGRNVYASPSEDSVPARGRILDLWI
ncbi:MAG: hypothetical protein JW950_07665 [Deltaproteobacteria bacterium]|nr:hypothetical protein [Deltaproteobacteria bacterium]